MSQFVVVYPGMHAKPVTFVPPQKPLASEKNQNYDSGKSMDGWSIKDWIAVSCGWTDLLFSTEGIRHVRLRFVEFEGVKNKMPVVDYSGGFMMQHIIEPLIRIPISFFIFVQIFGKLIHISIYVLSY